MSGGGVSTPSCRIVPRAVATKAYSAPSRALTSAPAQYRVPGGDGEVSSSSTTGGPSMPWSGPSAPWRRHGVRARRGGRAGRHLHRTPGSQARDPARDAAQRGAHEAGTPRHDAVTGYRVHDEADVRDARLTHQRRRGGYRLEQIAPLIAQVREAGGLEPREAALRDRHGRPPARGSGDADRGRGAGGVPPRTRMRPRTRPQKCRGSRTTWTKKSSIWRTAAMNWSRSTGLVT